MATASRVLPWRRHQETVTEELAPLLAVYRARHPRGSSGLIQAAYEAARRGHATQHRTSGELYINHPIAVARIVAELAARGVPMLPRGSGTALAGQSVNDAVVVDFSQNCRAILSVDLAARRAVVAMGFRVDRTGGAAQGKIVAFSGLQSGQDLAASRQVRLQIEISPYGTESRVRALFTEVLEADFARGPGHATENGLKDTPLYEVLFRRIEEGLKQP